LEFGDILYNTFDGAPMTGIDKHSMKCSDLCRYLEDWVSLYKVLSQDKELGVYPCVVMGAVVLNYTSL
jgi:hypothetical protein